MKQAIGLFISDVYVKALLDNLRGNRPEFFMSRTSIFKSMKYHIAFFAAGIAASLYLLSHSLNLVSAVDLGWIWYNSI